MIRKILLGIGAAFAVLFLGMAGLVMVVFDDREEFIDHLEWVSSSPAPNGSFQLIVLKKEEANFGENHVKATSYWLVLQKNNQFRQRRVWIYYGAVPKEADCSEGLAARWKNNSEIEIISRPFISAGGAESSEERSLLGQNFHFQRMTQHRNANCP
jgi:hypothetical protein